MKKILIALASVAALALFAAESPAAVNKVDNKNWWPLRSKNAGEVVNVDKKTGLIEVVNVGKDAKGNGTCTGAVQGINLNQTAVRAVKVPRCAVSYVSIQHHRAVLCQHSHRIDVRSGTV